MFKVPEKYRLKSGSFKSTADYGNNGAFIIPHYKITGLYFCIIASDGEGWEHVSITFQTDKNYITKNCDRTPTWAEMWYIKDLFWSELDAVVQYHPPKQNYINNHKYCLHLWRPTNMALPLPPSILVGI